MFIVPRLPRLNDQTAVRKGQGRRDVATLCHSLSHCPVQNEPQSLWIDWFPLADLTKVLAVTLTSVSHPHSILSALSLRLHVTSAAGGASVMLSDFKLLYSKTSFHFPLQHA